MKNISKLVLLVFLLSLTNCQVEEEVTKNQPSNDVLKVKDVSITQVPQIIDELTSIKSKIKESYANKRTIYDFELDESVIKEIELANGNKNYSFAVKHEFDEDDVFFVENLNVLIKNGGYEAFVNKYIPADGLEFKDMASFTGKLQYLDLEGRLVVEVDIVDGYFTQNRFVHLTLGCQELVFWWIESIDEIYLYSVTNTCGEQFYYGGNANTSGSSQNSTPFSQSNPNPTPTSGPSTTIGGTGTSSSSSNNTSTNPYYTTPNIPISITNPPVTDNDINSTTIITNQFYNLLFRDKKMLMHQKPLIYQQLSEYLSQNITNDVINAEDLAFANDVVNKIFQNPDLFISIKPFLIEKQINDTDLDPCAKGVLNQLKNLQQNDIATIIAKFDNPSTVYQLNFASQTPPINPNNSAETDWVRNANGEGIDNNYSISINPTFENQATSIAIARTLLHEILHAYILSYIDNLNLSVPVNPTEFPIIYQAALNNTYNNDPNQLQHIQISRKFIIPLRDALKELDNSSQSLQYYEDLAWGALNETSTFNILYPINSVDRDRILATNNSEDTNSSSTSGSQTVSPIGNPCN